MCAILLTLSNWEYFKQYPVIFVTIYILIPICIAGLMYLWIRQVIDSRRSIDVRPSWDETLKYAEKIAEKYPDKAEAKTDPVPGKSYVLVQSEEDPDAHLVVKMGDVVNF